MPYNAEFRKQVLDTVSNLTGDGILYNRKTHTLDHVINTYIAKTCEKHSMLGYSILERMTSHVKHIFTHLNCETPYEVLEFINTVAEKCIKCINVIQL